MADMVELLIEIPGLPVQVGRFRRVGIFDLVLAKRLRWIAKTSGHTDVAWIGPTDWAWRYPGALNVASWFVGAEIIIESGGIVINVPTDFERVTPGAPRST